MISQSSTSPAFWRDYLDMCKPRVVLLMLVCAMAGMLLSTASIPPPQILVFGLLGIALVAASAATVNQIADVHIDARMARTQARPLAQGRVTLPQAVLFAAVLVVLGVMVLAIFTNMLTVLLNLAAWVGYGLIYTLYLKHATPQNIVIGGLFGAAPPLLGWSAVTGTVAPGALLLVAIIFTWTPPHFWSLALDRKEEYANVDIPMLPVTHGERHTGRQIFLYTLLLIACSLSPVAIGMSGLLYLAGALLLNAGYLYWAILLLIGRDPRAPAGAFRYSIFYLALLFALLVVDHYLLPGGIAMEAL